MDSVHKQMLELLSDGQFMTGAQLAQALGISERTVRTKLGEFDRVLENHGARLEAKRRIGYRLLVEDQTAFDAWRKKLATEKNAIPTTSDERVQFILAYLLNHDEYIKLEDLSALLYISRNTVTADLKRVEEIFKEDHLTISRRPNYGIRLEGSEFDRRICITKRISRDAFYSGGAQSEAALLRMILSTVVKELHIQMTENAFGAMVVHIHVANQRQRQGHFMVYSESDRTELRQRIAPASLTAARRLAQELEKHTGVCSSEDEILYLAIHLSAKTTSNAAKNDAPDSFQPQQAEELATQMVEAVLAGNGLDFRDDEELRKALCQHLIPLDTRLRFGIPLINPILDHIKTEYSYAFMVATTACTVLRAYYKKPIPQGEVGYIAILFGLAIEKREKVFRRKNIVVVCASGRGTSQLFLYKCKQVFGKYIDHIYEKTIYELSELDYEGLEIDCIFSTIPLDNMPLPVPIYQVSPFLDNQEIERLQRVFEVGDDDFLTHYFDARLFIPRMEETDKETILKQMCDHARQFKTMEEEFYPLVLKREAMGQTDFGNLVAIPHAYRIASPDRFVMTAILDKPIWWGHNDAQVIFLISLPESRDETVESFYRAMLNFQADPALVEQVIKNPTFESLMEAFREAGKR